MAVETIGERITRLRTGKGWSRPELGREMAKAIDRKKPFSGELIRLYEEDENRPGADARAALAKVFDKSEPYIEFGQSAAGHVAREPAGAEYDTYSPIERQLIARFRAADPRWKLSLQLLAALAVEDQIEVASDVNVIVARILGKKPADVRYASDERVAATLRPVPTTPPVRKSPLVSGTGRRARRPDKQ